MTDERSGKPSGSGAQRWLACPGSHLAQRGLPDDSGDDATEGTMLHAVLAGEKTRSVDLTEDQNFCLDFCVEQMNRLLNQIWPGVPKEDETLVEKRMWLRDDELEPVASAKLDRVTRYRNTFLAVDWKMGRRPVEPADTNAQLRFAAAVIKQEWPDAEEIFVAIVAPRAEGERVTLARFSGTQALAAIAEMVAGAKRAMIEGQPRNPSPKACHYCRARGTARCPESIAAATALAVAPEGELTPATLATLLDRCELAERVIDAIRAKSKQTLADGGAIPGWHLKPGNVVTKINNPQAAWGAVGVRIGGANFAQCCTVSLPALSKAYKAHTQAKSEKAAREEVEKILTEAGAIEQKQNAPSLARVQEGETS